MEPKSPSKSKLQFTGFICNPRSRKLVTVTILIILILGIIGGYLIYKQHILMPEKMTTYYTVVLDCGSTGSRVNVFEWMIRNGAHLPILLHTYPNNSNKSNGCEYHCMQTEPGLHNFVNDAFGVRASLEPLIRYAEQLVPLDRRSNTPLFVLATAGMRRLVDKDKTRVLKDVENVVKESLFLFAKSSIRVLSGKEEAYYGWVALNYKMGVFGSSSRSLTLGLLDLGGSSLQIVAQVDNVKTKDEHVFRSKFGKLEHDIVAYSLPAFGLNEAFDRTVVMLSHTRALRENVGGIFEIIHPCLGSGFVQNYTCRGCFGEYSRGLRDLSQRVGENELTSVLLVGEANWEQCKVIARAVAVNSSSLEMLEQVHNSNCIGLFSYGGKSKLNLTETLHTVTRYHALSGFFAIYHALNLSQRPNLTTLWESGEKLCSRSWTDRTNINGQYCFRVPYLTSLIENALCLGGTEVIFGPGDVSWTLGASLIEGEFLWHHNDKLQNPVFALKDNLMIMSPLVTFVFLLFLLLVVYWCQIKLPMPGRKIVGTRTSLPFCLYPKGQVN